MCFLIYFIFEYYEEWSFKHRIGLYESIKIIFNNTTQYVVLNGRTVGNILIKAQTE